MPLFHTDVRGVAMVSHFFFYQLALIALVWLFVMLHVTWPSPPAPRIRLYPSRHAASAPTTPHRLRDLCSDLIASRVHTMPRIPNHRRLCDPTRCHRRIDTPAGSIPHSISVLIRAVAIAAGSGWATSVPIVIPVAVPGDNSTARRAKASFPSIMARSFMGSRSPWSSSSAS